jgi:membrane associated rhomboid family serine protease
MKKRIINILVFILILWGIKVIDTFLPYDLCQLGIIPRTVGGLIGIALSPLLHSNYFHLMSNTIPIFIFLLVLFTFYEKHAIVVIVGSVLLGGALVWLFGRSASHVGISGLIYSIAAFFVMAGFFKKDVKSLIITLLTIGFYGGLIWGFFPRRYWISWEGHLFGAIVGIFIAYFLFKREKTTEIA